MNVDEVTLNFNAEGLLLLNFLLAFIMFGVALDLKLADFKRVIYNPKASAVGLISQWLVLPLITMVLIFLFDPQPSIALGMVLVAVCPGGNVSNFVSKLAGANTALSVSLTALTTSAAIFMTPLSFAFWASFLSETSSLQSSISINVWDMFYTIIILIVVPVAIGLLFNHYFPALTNRIKKPINVASILFFAIFVVIAFMKNANYFIEYIHIIFVIVLFHNGLAFLAGFWIGKLFGLELSDQKAISIETGIQNSGLGLVLIFNFFDGIGGMAIVAGWWGIWHILAGLSMAYYWSGKRMFAS
ncbi:bile acid:sodium symporter family protein [Marivirga sp. S37H4]|uniref:Bile acid:sodium symporter family protein n=1 Tax=Marivirga aurantiaca TaxID=2802615 RepID=A0A934X1Z7_9BACT|nr:bile acid:sodium symporter family protein [Marivirga aurantiaca]MBK6266836.1 bile acid:sodium symporter family protein [Marivirga aurantiaca]